MFGPQVPVRAQRVFMDAASRAHAVPKQVVVTDMVLGGRPVRRFAVPGATEAGAVLWAHGGAFITGSLVSHGAFAGHLAVACGAPVYLLDYRLAPEHRHPAAVDDLVAALALVPEPRVVLGGDSAGGNLALLAAPRAERELAGLALVSPVVDLTLASSAAWNGPDPLIRTAWAKQGVAAMFGGRLPEVVDPTVPCVVHVSEQERLRPEGEALARRIGAELVVVPEAWHDIHLQAGLVRRADEAVADLGRSIRQLLA